MDGSKPDNIVQCLTECQNLYKSRGILQKDVIEFFCARCRNDNCARAGHGETAWLRRMSTQVERMFHTDLADPNLPQYKEFLDKEFRDMTQHAMRLIISSQRGDWEVPDMSAINQAPSPSRFMTGDQEIETNPEDLQRAIAAMGPSPEEFLGDDALVPEDGGTPFVPEDDRDAPFGRGDMVDIETEPLYPDFVGDLTSSEPLPPQGPSLRAQVSSVEANQKASKAGNVQRRDGIMLRGDSTAEPEPEADPWAVPDHLKPGAKKVQVGGTFTFGPGPEGEEKE